MDNSRFRLKASKLAAEVRFRPNLEYFDSVFKRAASLEEEFEDWRTQNNPPEAVLYSNSTKELFRVGADNITWISEQADYYETLQSNLERVYTIFLTSSNIQQVRRMGIRHIQVVEVGDDFSGLANKFFEAFTGNVGTIKDLSVDTVDDYAFVLDGIKNGLKTRVRFGPVHMGEAEDRFSPLFNDRIDLKGDANVYIDIDIYLDTADNSTEIQKNIPAIVEESKRICGGYFNTIKGVIAS